MSPPLRLLLLEDSPDHAELIERTIVRAHIEAEVRVVANEREFREALSSFEPQLILADLMLPGFSGIQAVTIAHEWDPIVPSILVSGVPGEELAVSSLRAGAIDYVLKTRLDMLPGAIRRALDEATEKRLLHSLDAERQRSEAALRESEAKYRRIVDTTSEAILALASDGTTTTFVNAAMAAMLGSSVEELTGQDITPFLFDEDRAAHADRIQLRRTGVAERYERRFRRVDGRVIWTEVSATPIFDDEHRYGGSFAMLTDVTERREAEEERAHYVHFLESLECVDRAVQNAGDLDAMMSAVLEATLSIFDADRAFLLHPCDPTASTWSIPKEAARPEFPGAGALGLDVPMDDDVADKHRRLLASDEPVAFEYPEPTPVSTRFGFQSMLSTALRPRVGKPWEFGIQQCRAPRSWTPRERRLLAEIGHRLEDALTALSLHREVMDSERRYRQVFENSPVPLWEEDFGAVRKRFDELRATGVADLDAYLRGHPEEVARYVGLVRFLGVNQAALTLHGASSQDELMAGLATVFAPESLETFRSELVCLWKGGTTMSADALVRTLTGEPLSVAVQFAVCPGYEESLERIIVSTVDLTKRRQADEAIRALNQELARQVEQYRLLLEQASDAIFVSDADRRYTDVNVAACELLGYSRDELLELSIWDVVPPDVNAGQANRFARMGAGQTVLSERLLRRKDGSLVPTELTSRQLPDGRYQAIVRDITLRKRLEEEQVRLATAVDQADEAIVITDPSARIVYVNPAFERVSGYTRAELIGQNPRILHGDRSDPELYRQMWTMLSAGHVWHGTFRNKRRNGELYEEDAAITPIRDENGVVVSYVGVKRDVTRERALEDQLRQSQKMEAIGQLAGGIAHDFNNLITAIRGYSELVREALPADDALRDDIDQVVLAADRAADLTRQLLAFSRRQVLRTQLVAPAQIVERLSPMLRRLLGEHIELVVHASREPGYVMADPSQLEQIILNLAVNARDAMPGGGSLIIETDTVTELNASDAKPSPAGYVVLRAIDTGTGMDAATMARVFEPFFTTKGPGEGTGMGLATVYGIVRQSSGDIRLQSEPGRGTTFTIYLPHVSAQADPSSEAGREKHDLHGTGTVLLVEDDPTVRGFAARSLTGVGYRVIEARDGAHAVTCAEEHGDGIDLLVTDVVMPRMGGVALVGRLRAARPGLPVVFVSGFAKESDEIAALLSSNTFLLVKPFSRESLAAAVGDALRNSAK